MPTLYEHAGGWETLYRFSECFYHRCLADPILQPLFGSEQPGHVERFTAFHAESFGGPDRFTGEMGGFAHLSYKITEEQRQRFVALYLEAADGVGLPADRPFREALRSHVEFGSRVAMQNSNATTDAELHPLRSVPRWNWPPGDAR